MDVAPLVISLISGLIGGNVAGAAAPDKSIGTVGNSATGLLGGALGGYILQALELLKNPSAIPGGAEVVNAASHLDIGSILANAGSGGVGGAILALLAGVIKNALANK